MHDLVLNKAVIQSKDFGGDTPPILSPNKGKWLPRSVVNPAYDLTTQTADFAVVVTDTEVQHIFTIRDKTEAELDADKTSQITMIKVEAGQRIQERYPLWQQLNMTALGTELNRIGETNWTPEQASQMDDLQAAWDWVKSVRATSDRLEIDLPEDYADDQYWPV